MASSTELEKFHRDIERANGKPARQDSPATQTMSRGTSSRVGEWGGDAYQQFLQDVEDIRSGKKSVKDTKKVGTVGKNNPYAPKVTFNQIRTTPRSASTRAAESEQEEDGNTTRTMESARAKFDSIIRGEHLSGTRSGSGNAVTQANPLDQDPNVGRVIKAQTKRGRKNLASAAASGKSMEQGILRYNTKRNGQNDQTGREGTGFVKHSSEEYGQQLRDRIDELDQQLRYAGQRTNIPDFDAKLEERNRLQNQYNEWENEMYYRAQAEALSALSADELHLLDEYLALRGNTTSATPYSPQERGRMAAYNELYRHFGDQTDSLLEYRGRQLNAAYTQALTADYAERAKQAPVGASALSVLTNIAAGPMAAVSTAGQMISRGLGLNPNEHAPLDTNDYGYRMQNLTKALRQSVTEEILGGDPENISTWRQIAGSGYQTVMSTLDSLAAAGLGPVAGAFLMSTNAATTTLQDYSERGASPKQAVEAALAAGFFEYIFEAISIGNLKALQEVDPQSIGQVLGNIARSMGVNFTEEALTELANAAADMALPENISSYKTRIRQLQQQGKLSREEAQRQAAAEIGDQVLQAGVGGALQGLLMGGVGSAAGYINNRDNRAEAARMQTQGADQTRDTVLRGEERAAQEAARRAEEEQAPAAPASELEITTGREYFQDQAPAAETAPVRQAERQTQVPAVQAAAEELRAEPVQTAVQETEEIQEARQIARETVDSVLQENSSLEDKDAAIASTVELYRDMEQNAAADAIEQLWAAERNGTTAPAVNEIEPGQAAVREYEEETNYGRPEIVPGDSIQRNDGAGAGGEAGELAAPAGGDQTGSRGSSPAKTAVGRQNRVNGLQSPERVSPRQLGVRQGVETPDLTVMPREIWDDDMRETAERVKAETGLDTVYYTGTMKIQTGRGTTRRVQGVVVGNRILLQADNLRVDIGTVADHEIFHTKVRQDPGLVYTLREQIQEQYSEEEFRRIVDAYAQALDGVYAGEDGLNVILEELFADAYAGMNAFGAEASRYQETARAVVNQRAGTGRYVGDAETRAGPGRYSVEEDENARRALEYFGKTYRWNETGYLTRDGARIDFSGRHDGAPGGYRTVDHRDISDALGLDYAGEGYSDAMVKFMQEGNIRISPENGGINLQVEPTAQQYRALDDYISRNRGEVILDIDNAEGQTVESREYDRGTRASRVLNDIREYFKTGVLPQQSETAQFHEMYSISGDEDAETRAGPGRYSVEEDEDNTAITQESIQTLRSIGKKSISQFTNEDIKKSEPWARKFYAELGNKSPFFRAWFGDWRAYDNTPVQTVEVTDTVFNKDFLRSIEHGNFHNNDVNWDVTSGALGIGDTVSHAGRAKVSVKMMSEIRSLIQNAILLDTEVSTPGGRKNQYTAFMHKMYVPVEFGNKPYLAKLSVEEYGYGKGNGRRVYNLHGIEMVPAGGTLDAEAFNGTVPDTRTDYSVADLYRLVKLYDKDFQGKEPSKVVNRDGTPRVVYHRTNAEFTAFDPSRSGSNQGQTHGDGIYISTSRDAFDYAGSNVMELYASIKNPFEMEMTEEEANRVYDKYAVPHHNDRFGLYRPHAVSSLMSYTKVFDYLDEYAKENGIRVSDILKDLGYDGVHDGPEWVAFDPEQLKSATDNIGTFDRGNPDIRYSSADNEEDVRRPAGITAAMRSTRRGINEAFGITRRDARAMAQETLNAFMDSTLERGEVDPAELERAARTLWREGGRQGAQDEYAADIRQWLRENTPPLYVPQEVRSEFSTDWGRTRQALSRMGIRVTESAADMGVDQFWQSLGQRFPGTFDQEETDRSEMLRQILDWGDRGRAGWISNQEDQSYGMSPSQRYEALREELYDTVEAFRQAVQDTYDRDRHPERLSQRVRGQYQYADQRMETGEAADSGEDVQPAAVRNDELSLPYADYMEQQYEAERAAEESRLEPAGAEYFEPVPEAGEGYDARGERWTGRRLSQSPRRTVEESQEAAARRTELGIEANYFGIRPTLREEAEYLEPALEAGEGYDARGERWTGDMDYFDGDYYGTEAEQDFDPDYRLTPRVEGERTQGEILRDESRNTAEEALQNYVSQGDFRATDHLNRLGVKIDGSVPVNYGMARGLLYTDEANRSILQDIRRAERRLGLDARARSFASDIAAGLYTEADIPSTMDADKVMELAQYYMDERALGRDMIRQQRVEINQQLDDRMKDLFREVDEVARRQPQMVRLNYNTPQRNMRALFGDELGERINREIFDPVARNEAERIRWINRQFDAVRTFEDSRGKRSGLTKEESALVQMVIEGRGIAEQVASMEMEGAIRDAAEDIRHGGDPSDAAREHNLSQSERNVAEKYARWIEAQELLESDRVDSVKIENAVKTFQNLFNQYYDAINDFLVVHGYAPIGFIRGYAPHMQSEESVNALSKVLKAFGIKTDVTELDTGIAGRTKNFRPNKRWNPYFLSREGDTSNYDILTGFESYIDYLSDVLYHTDDIMKLRRMSRYFRQTYSGEEIRNTIDWAMGLQDASREQQMEFLRDQGRVDRGSVLSDRDVAKAMDEYMDQLFDQITKTTKFGNLVMWLDNYTNILAGKQNSFDRGPEELFGRRSLNIGSRMTRWFARSNVAGNLSSVLNQASQLPMVAAENGYRNTTQALFDILSGRVRKTGFAEQSDLLTGKHGVNFLVRTPGEMVTSALFKPAEFADGLVSTIAVRAAYRRALDQGMSEADAMRYADQYGTEIMASRAKGSKPNAFESRNFFMQAVNMFQIEALNSWEHIFRDLPKDFHRIAATQGKRKAALALAGVIVKALLGAFVMNRITEELYGGTPAPFDILGLTANFVASGRGLSTNDWIRRLIDNGMERISGERIFGTESQDKDQAFKGWDAVEDTFYNLSNEVPFWRNASGLLGWGDETLPLPDVAGGISDILEATKNNGVISGETGEAAASLVTQFLPLGKQGLKTYQGIRTMAEGARMKGYGDRERLQYLVEDSLWNWIRAVMFGNAALGETQSFYASGERGLSKEQTRRWKAMVQNGIEPEEALSYIRFKGQEGIVKADVMDYIDGLNLTNEQKDALYYDAGYAESRINEAPWH